VVKGPGKIVLLKRSISTEKDKFTGPGKSVSLSKGPTYPGSQLSRTYYIISFIKGLP